MNKHLILNVRLTEASLVVFKAGRNYQFSINRTVATKNGDTKVYTAMLVSVVYTDLLVTIIHANFCLNFVNMCLSELKSRAPNIINFLKYEIDAKYNEKLAGELLNLRGMGLPLLPVTTTEGNMRRRALTSRVKQAKLLGVHFPGEFNRFWDEFDNFDFGGRGITGDS